MGAKSLILDLIDLGFTEHLCPCTSPHSIGIFTVAVL